MTVNKKWDNLTHALCTTELCSRRFYLYLLVQYGHIMSLSFRRLYQKSRENLICSEEKSTLCQLGWGHCWCVLLKARLSFVRPLVLRYPKPKIGFCTKDQNLSDDKSIYTYCLSVKDILEAKSDRVFWMNSAEYGIVWMIWTLFGNFLKKIFLHDQTIFFTISCCN